MSLSNDEIAARQLAMAEGQATQEEKRLNRRQRRILNSTKGKKKLKKHREENALEENRVK